VAEHTPRRRGRHAEGIRNDQRLLDAAREVFASYGSAASVSLVAAHAGVGIASLYRRYGSKTELLQQLCVQAMEQTISAAAEALRTADPVDALTSYIRASVALRTGALSALAGTIDTSPQMWELSRKARSLQRAIVERAHRDGRLRSDVSVLDIAWMIELFGRASPSGDADRDERNVHQRLLAISIDGLYATDAVPLPGTPPTDQHYEQRWRTATEGESANSPSDPR
jgi:AcrR family transcriptional regulator